MENWILCFEGFYNEPPSIAKCPFFLHSKPHDYPQMSQLPSKCHDYPQNVTITLKMSQLPSKCHDYPQNVTITLQMSRLPSKCHDYPQNVSITLQMSWLPKNFWTNRGTLLIHFPFEFPLEKKIILKRMGAPRECL